MQRIVCGLRWDQREEFVSGDGMHVVEVPIEDQSRPPIGASAQLTTAINARLHRGEEDDPLAADDPLGTIGSLVVLWLAATDAKPCRLALFITAASSRASIAVDEHLRRLLQSTARELAGDLQPCPLA